MPSSVKLLKVLLWLGLSLALFPALASEYGVNIKHLELIRQAESYKIDSEIDYQLSPTAKEALEKGIPLTWDVQFEIRQPGFVWAKRIYKKRLRYTLQYHALLKQYKVIGPDNHLEMFLSLTAALNYMASPLRGISLDTEHLDNAKQYFLALKTSFNRESLPVPLRPFAYLDRQWFLSSPWMIWPFQK